MEPKVWLPNPSSLPPHTPPQFSFAAYPLVAWSCSKYPSLGLTCTACTQCLPAHLYPQVPDPNDFLIPGTTNNIISHLDACTHCFSSPTCGGGARSSGDQTQGLRYGRQGLFHGAMLPALSAGFWAICGPLSCIPSPHLFLLSTLHSFLHKQLGGASKWLDPGCVFILRKPFPAFHST